MRITVVYFLIFMSIQLPVFADKNLSKDEVRDYWNRNLRIDLKKDLSLFPDSSMVDFVRKMQNSGIDTLGGFYCSGYYKSVPISELKNRKWADCDSSYWTGLVYWRDKGYTYSKKFYKTCNFPISILPNSSLFDFIIPRLDTLKNEQIINLNGICLTKDGNVLYIKDLSDHTTNFMLYLSINKTSIFKKFDLDDIDNESYLFHIENKTSIQNQLRQKIEKEIEEKK